MPFSTYTVPAAAQGPLATINRIVSDFQKEKRPDTCRKGFVMTDSVRVELNKLEATPQLAWVIQYAPNDKVICICMIAGDCQFPDTCHVCLKFLAKAPAYGIPPFPAMWVKGAVFYRNVDESKREIFRVEEEKVLVRHVSGMIECVDTFKAVFEGEDNKQCNYREFCAYDNCRFGHPPGWDAKIARSKRLCPFDRTCWKRYCEYTHYTHPE